MKQLALIGLLLLLSCANPDPQAQLNNLSGYWEITQVEFPDGSKKDFDISTTIDFISIEDSLGIRKKLSPTLKGTYYTSRSQESFTFGDSEEGLVLYYKTPYDSWQETVITAKDSVLVVQNKDGNLYKYKRFNRQINIE
ncbi:MAG: hypothetical protein ABJM06_02230 [Gilvibacter sp.]